MKSSAYNISFELPEIERTILYNSLYGSIAALKKEEYEQVKSAIAYPEGPLNIEHSLKRMIIKQKYLIEDKVDELEIIKNRKYQGINDGRPKISIPVKKLVAKFV